MNLLSTLLNGFSIISALILLVAYSFFLEDMRKSQTGKIACAVMLLCLATLQLAHALYFGFDADLLSRRDYCVLLFLLPPAFFFFSREVLFLGRSLGLTDLLHLLPLITVFILPVRWLPPLAFAIGSAYTFIIAHKISKLRGHTDRFRFERFFFGFFFLIAILALALGLALPVLDHSVFYHAYSNSIAIAFVLVVAALLIFPELLSDILLITESAYAKTKLAHVDVDAKLVDLERLMIEDRQYQHEELTLGSLAELTGLSSHQLSELINTRYGYGFPRFVREHRIRAAKTLLINEPNASVLSVSMATGFRSQSSFYTAFKESTGLAPGSYRKENLK